MENDIKISKTVILNNFDQYDDAIIGHMVPTEIHQLKSHMKRLKRGLATSHTFLDPWIVWAQGNVTNKHTRTHTRVK